MRCKLLISILFIGAFLRIYHLGKESIWIDEAATLSHIEKPLPLIIKNVIQHDVSPPFYFFLLHFWTKFFGRSEIGVRSLSVVFGIVSIFLIYKLGVILFTEKEGLLSAALFALGRFPIWAAQEGRMYSLFIMLVLISTLLFVGWLRNKKGIIPLTIVNIFITYTHVYGIFFVGSEALYLLFRERSYIRKWLPFFLIVGVFYIPWFLVQRQQALDRMGGFWIGKPGFLTLYYILWKFSSQHKALVIPFFILSLVGVIMSFKEKKDYIFFLLIWILVPIAMGYILSYLVMPCLASRYVIFTLPAYYLLISNGALKFRGIALRVIISGLILLSLYCLYSYYPESTKSEIRKVAEYVTLNKADIILIFYETGPFNYYYKGTTPVIEIKAHPFTCEVDTHQPVDDIIPKINSLWYIVPHWYKNKPLADLPHGEELTKHFHLRKIKSFYGIELYYGNKRI